MAAHGGAHAQVMVISVLEKRWVEAVRKDCEYKGPEARRDGLCEK